MTEIEQKVLALVNEVRAERGMVGRYLSLDRLGDATTEALCRAIEQHEATKQELADYKQEVSDAVVCYFSGLDLNTSLHRFVIPAPKPDPLVEAMADCGVDRFESWADQLRAALNARGLEIREKNDGL